MSLRKTRNLKFAFLFLHCINVAGAAVSDTQIVGWRKLSVGKVAKIEPSLSMHRLWLRRSFESRFLGGISLIRAVEFSRFLPCRSGGCATFLWLIRAALVLKNRFRFRLAIQ